MNQNISLIQKIKNREKDVFLIGTAPPKVSSSNLEIDTIVSNFIDRVSDLELDGVIVYDIQDESSRISSQRPFPYTETIDPLDFSQRINNASGIETITYNSVGKSSNLEFKTWLTKCKEISSGTVLVGAPAHKDTPSFSLTSAYSELSFSNSSIPLGGVCIAERHCKKGDEHLRMIDKQRHGCEYFVSQAVYDAPATIGMLKEYAYHCANINIEPKRIILTFTPCGSEKTLEFMKWLGISIPKDVEERMMSSASPLEESLDLCEKNLKEIIKEVRNLGLSLGLNVESITNRKVEIDASIELFMRLSSIYHNAS